MKSYSIQQKPCQFIAEGCSYQLQRYKNNLKKQMILQENRKIDRNRLYPAPNNWRESHSRFYPSPTLHRQLRPDVQLFISGEQNIATPRAIFCPDQAQNETS